MCVRLDSLGFKQAGIVEEVDGNGQVVDKGAVGHDVVHARPHHGDHGLHVLMCQQVAVNVVKGDSAIGWCGELGEVRHAALQ